MAAASSVLQIGKPAPGFRTDAVVDEDFKVVSLDDYKGSLIGHVRDPSAAVH